MADSENESGKECDAVTCSSETCDSETSSVPTGNKVKSVTLPHKLDIKQIDWDELDDLLQVRQVFCYFYYILLNKYISLPFYSSLCIVYCFTDCSLFVLGLVILILVPNICFWKNVCSFFFLSILVWLN